MYLSPEELIGMVDLRSLGYYNIKPQVMHFNLTGIHNLFSKWNLDLRFEEHFVKVSTQNVLYWKREVVRKPSDPYPWLDKDDPQRNMTDEVNSVPVYRPFQVASDNQGKRRGNGSHSYLQESF